METQIQTLLCPEQQNHLGIYRRKQNMSNPNSRSTINRRKQTAISIGLGVALGAALGAALGNIALGLVVGILIGSAGALLRIKAS
jgi:hypothetical protein